MNIQCPFVRVKYWNTRCMYCGTLMKKNQQHLLRHIGKRPMKATIRESKLFSGLLSLFPTSISACSEIGTLCRPLEGNNTGLNYVQLWTKEMEMKGIVTNKKERDRKSVNFLLRYLFCSLFRCKIEDTNCSNNRHLWIWQHIFLCLCKDRWCRDSVSTKQEKVNFIIPDKNAFWQ